VSLGIERRVAFILKSTIVECVLVRPDEIKAPLPDVEGDGVPFLETLQRVPSWRLRGLGLTSSEPFENYLIGEVVSYCSTEASWRSRCDHCQKVLQPHQEMDIHIAGHRIAVVKGENYFDGRKAIRYVSVSKVIMLPSC